MKHFLKSLTVLAITLTLLPLSVSFAQNNQCLQNFEWMVQAFSENDAGFQYVLEMKGEEAYRAHTESIRVETEATADRNQCREVLHDWLRFFRNGHIYISVNEEQTSQNGAALTDDEIREKYRHSERLDMTEDELVQLLSDKPEKDSIEGVWQMGIYRMGVVEDDQTKGLFRAFIIEADGVYWTPGQIKARFQKLPDTDEYDADFMMRDHSVRMGTARFATDSESILSISDLGSLWVRQYPESQLSAMEEIMVKAANDNEVFLERLGDKTLYLRIPSFFGSEKEFIDQVLSENDQLIRSVPNLIIDIRNGTGGSDMAYENIIPYLYTNPIRHVGAQLYASETNAKARDDLAEWAEESGYSDYAQSFRDQARLMRENPGEYVNPGEVMIGMETMDQVSEYPARVGILINEGNGSTDEQFLLEAKQSFKVKLFGRPTKGVLDISNVNVITSPDGAFNLHYSMSKSLRLPAFPIDDIGIQPDFYLDHEIEEGDWIGFVQNILEAN
jgi:hypothetical protein